MAAASIRAAGRIPTDEALCVEYPGFVRDVDRAIETLGGLRAVAHAKHDDSSLLQLRLRPDDPFAHPIFGETTPMTALVLRVRRASGERESQGGPHSSASATIVARVTQAVQFRGMADFQYLVRGSGRTLREDLDAGLASWTAADAGLSAGLGAGHDALEIPPTLFSPIDVVQDYTATWSGKKLISTAVPSDSKRARIASKQALARLEFTMDKPIPPRPSPPALEELSEASRAVYARLVELFDRRPVWTRLALDAQLASFDSVGGTSPAAVKLLIPYVAYYYLTGPWSRCYVKFGYDPRLSAESRIYQAIDVRVYKQSNRTSALLPSEALVGEHLAGEEQATALGAPVPRKKKDQRQINAPQRIQRRDARIQGEIASRTVEPSAGAQSAQPATETPLPQQRQFNMQLCDLKGEQLMEAVHAQPTPSASSRLVCDVKSGWYTAAALLLVREQLKGGYSRAAADGSSSLPAAAIQGPQAQVAQLLAEGRQAAEDKRRETHAPVAACASRPPPRGGPACRGAAPLGAAEARVVTGAVPLRVLDAILVDDDDDDDPHSLGKARSSAAERALSRPMLASTNVRPGEAAAALAAACGSAFAAACAQPAACRGGPDDRLGLAPVVDAARAQMAGCEESDVEDDGEEEEDGEVDDDDEGELLLGSSLRAAADSREHYGQGAELQTFLQQHVPLARAQCSQEGELAFPVDYGDESEDDPYED